jgi:hypothetical protein
MLKLLPSSKGHTQIVQVHYPLFIHSQVERHLPPAKVPPPP